MLQHYTFGLGVASLYLSFSAVFGTVLRNALHPHGQTWVRRLILPYGLLLLFPASILILNLSEWALLIRLGMLSMGLCMTYLAFIRPRWMPKILWLRSFGKIYLACAMALSALWGFSLSLLTQTVGSYVIAAAASVAGIASLWNALRPG